MGTPLSRMHYDPSPDGPKRPRGAPPLGARTPRFWVGLAIAVGLAAFGVSQALPVIYLVLLR